MRAAPWMRRAIVSPSYHLTVCASSAARRQFPCQRRIATLALSITGLLVVIRQQVDNLSPWQTQGSRLLPGVRPCVGQVVVRLIPLCYPTMQLAPLGKEHRAVGDLTCDGVLEDMAQVRVRRLLGDQ